MGAGATKSQTQTARPMTSPAVRKASMNGTIQNGTANGHAGGASTEQRVARAPPKSAVRADIS